VQVLVGLPYCAGGMDTSKHHQLAQLRKCLYNRAQLLWPVCGELKAGGLTLDFIPNSRFTHYSSASSIMMWRLITANVIFSVINTVSAHGWIDKWIIGDRNYTGFNPTIAPWVPDQSTIAWPAWNNDTGPVYSNRLNTSDIICSINATNAQLYATSVAAGSTINLHWTVWPDSHHGPIFSYLAACDGDCAAVDKYQLKWFKIAELGQILHGKGNGSVGVWASDQLRETEGAWSVTVPSAIKAGNYVLRNEIVALHSAYDVGAAQFYPQCANIKITGNGTVVPSGVLGTSLYNQNDPGVHYNIYNDELKPSYPMPGPPCCEYYQIALFCMSIANLELVTD